MRSKKKFLFQLLIFTYVKNRDVSRHFGAIKSEVDGAVFEILGLKVDIIMMFFA